MAIEGKIRHRNGKMFVVYTTTSDSKPIRFTRWYKVLESYSNRYNMNRPEDGDTARHGEGPNWTTSNRNGATGRVVCDDNAELVETGVEPPKSGGKELRWRDGRWEKLMAKGWVAAGEGGAGDPNNPNPTPTPRARKKSAKQLDAEIDQALAEPKAHHSTMSTSPELRVGQRFDYIGHIYEVTKIGRDKARTVQIARRSNDSFGRSFLIDHRSFPMREFSRQHLRPL